MEVLREGYTIPFLIPPPLSSSPISFENYSQGSLKAEALGLEVQSMLEKGALEVAGSDPGFYSRIFVVQKANLKWRPVIDLSSLNKFIRQTPFRMETAVTVLNAIRENDWVFSIDLQDAYFQVLVHPDSRRYLRFVWGPTTYQFRVLCFGLSTAPQVFTRVMAPVSYILHSKGIRLIRYLDDWLILASSQEESLVARSKALDLCHSLGILLNKEKSSLTPSRSACYLGMRIETTSLRAFPTEKRISTFQSLAKKFLKEERPTAREWMKLLGHLSSLCLLVPNGRRRTRSMQIALNQGWNRRKQKKSHKVKRPEWITEDLLWWMEKKNLERGRDFSPKAPDLIIHTDASMAGWGASILQRQASGRWGKEEEDLSINVLEIRAIRLALVEFEDIIQEKRVGIMADNTSALSYLLNEGGTHSPMLNLEAQAILEWTEERGILLLPQFVRGKNNVVADSLSRPNTVINTEWMLKQEEVQKLCKIWPATVDLFATNLNYRLPNYYSPSRDPMALGTDALLQDWENLEAYAFPPIAIIRRVLNKIRTTKNCTVTLIAPNWPTKEWYPDLMELMIEEPITLPRRRDLLRQPHFSRFHQNLPELQLTAWRLSSTWLRTGASPGRRQIALPNPLGHPQ